MSKHNFETTKHSNLNDELSTLDVEIFNATKQEATRQEEGIELIASENATALAVMQAQGSILTNKYAEGYPSKRFYGGCEYVDIVETLAIERAKKLFNANYANVQPHSGSNANISVLLAELQPGDSILGMDLSEGGHLTHGSPANFSGKIFKAHFYGINHDSGLIEYDKVAEIAKQVKPKLIIAGASAYSRIIDFETFRKIADDNGAILLVDMAHIAGLVAAKLHPSPIPHAHYVTSTTHKTLRGPRGGLVLTNKEARIKKINSIVFPGIQGGPLMHVIAGKAVAFKLANTDEFAQYQHSVVENARELAGALHQQGFEIISGGTDNHVFSVSLIKQNITGKAMQIALDKALITLNKNMVPADPRSPFVTSGVRIGTPTVTTRGMGKLEMQKIAAWIARVGQNITNEDVIAEVRAEVIKLTKKFPLYS